MITKTGRNMWENCKGVVFNVRVLMERCSVTVK